MKKKSRKAASRRNAPTRSLCVLTLAAGRGKRMHSRRVKLLHSLCGRSMLLYVVEAVTGLVSGDFRIIEFSRNGTLLKSVLQRPKGYEWQNISRHYHTIFLPWLKSDRHILQNIAA